MRPIFSLVSAGFGEFVYALMGLAVLVHDTKGLELSMNELKFHISVPLFIIFAPPLQLQPG